MSVACDCAVVKQASFRARKKVAFNAKNVYPATYVSLTAPRDAPPPPLKKIKSHTHVHHGKRSQDSKKNVHVVLMVETIFVVADADRIFSTTLIGSGVAVVVPYFDWVFCTSLLHPVFATLCMMSDDRG